MHLYLDLTFNWISRTNPDASHRPSVTIFLHLCYAKLSQAQPTKIQKAYEKTTLIFFIIILPYLLYGLFWLSLIQKQSRYTDMKD